MKSLLILDKAGTIGLQYAIVLGNISRFNGCILNDNSDISKECIEYLTNGMSNYDIIFTPDLSEFNGVKYYHTALVVYYPEVNITTATLTIEETVTPLEQKFASVDFDIEFK